MSIEKPYQPSPDEIKIKKELDEIMNIVEKIKREGTPKNILLRERSPFMISTATRQGIENLARYDLEKNFFQKDDEIEKVAYFIYSSCMEEHPQNSEIADKILNNPAQEVVIVTDVCNNARHKIAEIKNGIAYNSFVISGNLGASDKRYFARDGKVFLNDLGREENLNESTVFATLLLKELKDGGYNLKDALQQLEKNGVIKILFEPTEENGNIQKEANEQNLYFKRIGANKDSLELLEKLGIIQINKNRLKEEIAESKEKQ